MATFPPTAAPARAASTGSTRPGAGSISIVTMSMAAAGGCDSRSSSSSVRSTRAIAHRRRQLQHARVHRPIDEPQIEPERRRAAIGALERDRQRIEQPRQHERQRLQRVDRPLELHPLDEARHVRDPARAARGSQPQRELLQRARPSCPMRADSSPAAAPRARRASSIPSAAPCRTPARTAAAPRPAAVAAIRRRAASVVPRRAPRRSCCRWHQRQSRQTTAAAIRPSTTTSARRAPASAASPRSCVGATATRIGRTCAAGGIARQLCADRRRLAEQPPKPGHVADDAAGSLALRAAARNRARRRRPPASDARARTKAGEERGHLEVQGSQGSRFRVQGSRGSKVQGSTRARGDDARVDRRWRSGGGRDASAPRQATCARSRGTIERDA